MLITSFYTNEYYQNVYQKYLKQSIKKFKYHVHLFDNAVVYGEQYLKALELKPQHIITAYSLYRNHPEYKSLLYLDVDCEILRELDDLNKMMEDYDIAYRRYLNGHINCAVLAFSYNNFEKCLHFLYSWHYQTMKEGAKSSTVDQPQFEKLILENKYRLRLLELPKTYNTTVHDDKMTQQACIVYHHKIARQETNRHAREWRKHFVGAKND